MLNGDISFAFFGISNFSNISNFGIVSVANTRTESLEGCMTPIKPDGTNALATPTQVEAGSQVCIQSCSEFKTTMTGQSDCPSRIVGSLRSFKMIVKICLGRSLLDLLT